MADDELRRVAVSYIETARLNPPDRRIKNYSDDEVASHIAHIQHFGRLEPLRVWQGQIIDGEAWYLAAERLQITEIPILDLSNMSEVDARAYAIAIKKLAEAGEWDWTTIVDEWAWLEEQGFEDLDLTGFDQDERERQERKNEEDHSQAGEDDTPKKVVEGISQPGDVWQLGAHRLMCGDSTVPEEVKHLLNGVVPHLMITDPPSDDKADWRETFQLFPGEVAYTWHAGTKANIVGDSLEASGFSIRAQIIWVKHNLIVGRGHYHHQHEPCFYAVRTKAQGHWTGGNNQSTIWKFEKPQNSEMNNGAQKPVECMRRPMLNNSSEGQAVYDPFCGSGTTIIAAETSARACYAIEISPGYVDMSIMRWQQFTGNEARLVGDGRTFAAVESERQLQRKATK